MKKVLKFGFSALLLTVFVIGLTTVVAEPATAGTFCPSFKCVSTHGYSYIGSCLHDPGGCLSTCELWRINGGSTLCYTNCYAL